MVGIDINLSMSQVGRRPEKVLLVAYYEPRNVPSIVENIALLQRLSSFSISVLNLAEHRVDSGFLKIPPVVDLNDFEAVVNNRMIAIPSLALEVYNNYFSGHPLTHFCQINVTRPGNIGQACYF